VPEGQEDWRVQVTLRDSDLSGLRPALTTVLIALLASGQQAGSMSFPSSLSLNCLSPSSGHVMKRW
jgi:hypothetical protein